MLAQRRFVATTLALLSACLLMVLIGWTSAGSLEGESYYSEDRDNQIVFISDKEVVIRDSKNRRDNEGEYTIEKDGHIKITLTILGLKFTLNLKRTKQPRKLRTAGKNQ